MNEQQYPEDSSSHARVVVTDNSGDADSSIKESKHRENFQYDMGIARTLQDPRRNDELVLPNNYTLGVYDVGCGRGQRYCNHIGNQRFRAIVSQHVQTYIKAKSKLAKTSLIVTILQEVRMGGTHNSDHGKTNAIPSRHYGRFVKQQEDGMWVELGDSASRDKVSNALRAAVALQRDSLGIHPNTGKEPGMTKQETATTITSSKLIQPYGQNKKMKQKTTGQHSSRTEPTTPSSKIERARLEVSQNIVKLLPRTHLAFQEQQKYIRNNNSDCRHHQMGEDRSNQVTMALVAKYNALVQQGVDASPMIRDDNRIVSIATEGEVTFPPNDARNRGMTLEATATTTTKTRVHDETKPHEVICIHPPPNDVLSDVSMSSSSSSSFDGKITMERGSPLLVMKKQRGQQKRKHDNNDRGMKNRTGAKKSKKEFSSNYISPTDHQSQSMIRIDSSIPEASTSFSSLMSRKNIIPNSSSSSIVGVGTTPVTPPAQPVVTAPTAGMTRNHTDDNDDDHTDRAIRATKSINHPTLLMATTTTTRTPTTTTTTTTTLPKMSQASLDFFKQHEQQPRLSSNSMIDDLNAVTTLLLIKKSRASSLFGLGHHGNNKSHHHPLA